MAMTPLTGTPTRTMSQSAFDSACNDFFSTKLPLFVTEANALQTDVGNKQTAAASSASDATTQAGVATTQAGIATTQAALAEDWATQLGTPVSGGEYSAKYHAIAAAASAASAVNSPGTQATSTSSMTIGAVSQSFVLQQTGKAFVVGQWVNITDIANPSVNWMAGAITAFNSGTGAMTVNVVTVSGGGTISSWVVVAASATNSLPSATGSEGKILAVNSASATVWITPQAAWANWSLITANSGTFTVPDGVSQIRAYVFGKGGDGATSASGTAAGGGGGGGGCAYGTIPCKPGDVFTFDNTASQAKLKKGATAYLTTNDGVNASGATNGNAGGGGSVGAGLGITSSGTANGAPGGVGFAGTAGGGGGGASGSPIGTGGAGAASGSTLIGGGGGGGWGGAGSQCAGAKGGNGGGVGGAAVGNETGRAGGSAANGTGRDWSNAYTDPLLRPCTGAASGGQPSGAGVYPSAGQPGCGGYAGTADLGNGTAANGGLGGGGAGANNIASAVGGTGGFGGGGGGGSQQGPGAPGGIGGGGGGGGSNGVRAGGPGGSSAVLIFY